jgi:probable rRNA maturation factor
MPVIGELCLGDMVICPEIAERQAKEIGQATEREITFLCVHSMLHLLGYDHQTEDEERIMIDKQKAVMEDYA